MDFTGRGELAERQVNSKVFSAYNIISVSFIFDDINIYPSQQKLAQMLSRLIKIAEEFNVAVYMTNQGNLDLLSLMEVINSFPHSFDSIIVKSSFMWLVGFFPTYLYTYDL